MRQAIDRIGKVVDTLSGRMALLLGAGLIAASVISLLLAEHARDNDFEHVRMERVVDSIADMSKRFTDAPGQTEALLRDNRILGARNAPAEWRMSDPDSKLVARLSNRLGARAEPLAMPMSKEACFPNFDLAERAAGVTDITLPDCWYVTLQDGNGLNRRFSVDLMPLRIPPSTLFDPLSLLMIVLVGAGLSVVASRWATAPLRKLSMAAENFSIVTDAAPIEESGPKEVRSALRTFNVMQNRVREGFRERTQILAAVTHDLQTPLTRLRLRLEQVQPETLRDKLVSDLAVTQKLVRDGLEYARSIESSEPWSVTDIDSILSSIAEDAAELGWDVAFIRGCSAEVRTRPNALSRCLNNLVENAVKYAGSAELSCDMTESGLVICVRDFGPGIPADVLPRVLLPFQRYEAFPGISVPGSGLGLTIAEAQAKAIGATLRLENNKDDKGLVAIIALPLQRQDAHDPRRAH